MAERDIDTLNNELKITLKNWEQIRDFSLGELTSYVQRLDKKAEVDTTNYKFKGYIININELTYPLNGLPKILKEKLASGKGHVLFERKQGIAELGIVDSNGKNQVGVELFVSSLSETKVTGAGIVLLDAEGELEVDPNLKEGHGIVDQVFNYSEYIRAMVAHTIFSSVVKGLTSESAQVSLIEEKKSTGAAWHHSTSSRL